MSTPEQKWKKTILTCKKNCQKIMGVSKMIRYAAAINDYGRTLTGVVRPGVKPVWNAEQIKNEFFVISTLMTLHKGPAKSAGDLEYTLLRHKKITVIVFPQKNISYYISVETKNSDVQKLIKKIRTII